MTTLSDLMQIFRPKNVAILIVVILIIAVMSTILLGGEVIDDATNATASESNVTDIEKTATYGAEQFHLQLTAIATQLAP